MSKNEMTQATAIAYVLDNTAYVLPEDVRKKLIEVQTALAKRKGETKAQKELRAANASILDTILDNMEVGKKYTITDMRTNFEGMLEYTPSKLSAVIKPAIDNGTIVRTEEKGKPYFAKVEVEG